MGILTVFDSMSGQLIMELEGHEKAINSVAFSPDGRLLRRRHSMALYPFGVLAMLPINTR